ncbi:MAG: hypothetical protein AAYR33_00810 [Acetobacteraceae bacterium]
MGAETSGGLSVLPVGGKTRGLLTILALSDRKPVMRKTIADLCFGVTGRMNWRALLSGRRSIASLSHLIR